MNNEKNMNDVVSNQIDFVVYAYCEEGNPNGDPDSGNMPRVSEGKGRITNLSFKHHIREAVKKMYNETILFDNDYKTSLEEINKNLVKDNGNIVDAYLNKFIDVRAFGAVITDGGCKDSITGAVTIRNGKSIHNVVVVSDTINRCKQSKQNKIDKKTGEIKENNSGSQFGSKSVVEFGLYKFTGSVFPCQAEKTHFTYGDLEKIINGIKNSYHKWESNQKGEMDIVKFVVFHHKDKFGNYSASKIFHECVTEKLKDGVVAPTSYLDYDINVDMSNIPSTVSVETIV